MPSPAMSKAALFQEAEHATRALHAFQRLLAAFAARAGGDAIVLADDEIADVLRDGENGGKLLIEHDRAERVTRVRWVKP